MDRPLVIPVSAGSADQAVLSVPCHETKAEAQGAFHPAPTRKRRRPPYSYTALIAHAIILSEHKQLTLREIYDSINQMYPQICQGPDVGWQNTIRHNLSLNQCFIRIPRQQLPISLSSKLRGKGSYWTVDVGLMDANTKKRLDEAVSSTPAELLVRGGQQGQADLGSLSQRTDGPSDPTRSSPESTLQGPNEMTPTNGIGGGSFAYGVPDYRTIATATRSGEVRCISPIQSSTLYFQSALHSPIANIANHNTKHFTRPVFQRHAASRQPYPLPAPVPPRQPPRPTVIRNGRYHSQTYAGYSPMRGAGEYDMETHMGLALSGRGSFPSGPPIFNEGRAQASAMPIPTSSYLYGAAVSCSRSTARASGREPSGDFEGMSRGPASLASSSTLGSRQPSPYLPSPSSPLAVQARDTRDRNAPAGNGDSIKLKINHILN